MLVNVGKILLIPFNKFPKCTIWLLDYDMITMIKQGLNVTSELCLSENNVTYTGIFLIQIKSLLGQKKPIKQSCTSHTHSRDFNHFIGDKQVCHDVSYRHFFVII